MSGSKPGHRKSVWTGATVAVLVAFMAGPPVFASVGLYVGKNLTADGSVLLGGYGDEPSSHWLAIIPRLKHDGGATIEVGATSESRYPGVRSRIPQVPETYKYITVQYSAYAGFPPPLENGGHQRARRRRAGHRVRLPQGASRHDSQSTARRSLLQRSVPDCHAAGANRA